MARDWTLAASSEKLPCGVPAAALLIVLGAVPAAPATAATRLDLLLSSIIRLQMAVEPEARNVRMASDGRGPSRGEAGVRLETAKQGGCWLEGKWFPEGAKVYPPERSRIAVSGYSLCKNGKWVFIVTK